MKCYVCGLEAEGIPRRASCADAFAGDFMPLMPVDPKARGQIGLYKKYCRYMDISHYHLNASDPRSMWGRWTGGCSVRWTDIASVYTQRTCRNRHRATLGRHFASKRMAKLEMALQWRYPGLKMQCLCYHIAMTLIIKGGIWTLVGGPAAVRAEFPWVPDDDDEGNSDFYKKYQFEDAPPVINALPEETDDNQHLIWNPPYDMKINNDDDPMDVKDTPLIIIDALPDVEADHQQLTWNHPTDDKSNNGDDPMDVKGALSALLADRNINNWPDNPQVDFEKTQYIATASFVSSDSEVISPVATDKIKDNYKFMTSRPNENDDRNSKDAPPVINALPEETEHQHLTWNPPYDVKINNADDPMDVKDTPLIIIDALSDVEADHQQLTWNHPTDDKSNNADDPMDVKGALNALLADRNINNWPDNPQVDFEKTQYVATASFVSSDSEVISPVATDKIKDNYKFMTSRPNENDDRNSKVSATVIFLKTVQNNQDRKHSRRFKDDKNVSDLIRMKKQYYFELEPTRTKEPDVDKDAVKSTLSPEFDSSELNVSRAFKENMHTGAFHQILSGRETKGSTPVYRSEEDTTTTRITNAAEDKDTILKKVAENSLQTTKILRQGPDFSASLASRDAELASAMSQLAFLATQFSSMAKDVSPDFDPFINIFLPITLSTTRTPPRLDIPELLFIISNLTADYETNLTNWVNETLQKWSIPTCPTPTTTSTTTTTVTTPSHLNYETNGTGYLVAKCYVCGLEAEGIPRRAICADAFAGDFVPLMPVDPKARGQIGLFKKYCRFMDISHYHINASDPRSMWGRWTGGCAVRWTDIASVYTQRTCRNRHRATLGKHFASKRMAKLEMALQNIDDGCIGSPAASLLVVSRGISIYAKFHACVCSGPWCNRGVFSTQWSWYLALLPLFALLVCW